MELIKQLKALFEDKTGNPPAEAVIDQRLLDEWELITKKLMLFSDYVKKLKKRSEEIEDELIPVVKRTEKKVAQVNRIILTYKTPTKTKVAYKEPFEAAFSKLNQVMKEQVSAILLANTDSKTVDEVEIFSPEIATIAKQIKNAKTLDDLEAIYQDVFGKSLKEGVAKDVVVAAGRWAKHLARIWKRHLRHLDHAVEDLIRASMKRVVLDEHREQPEPRVGTVAQEKGLQVFVKFSSDILDGEWIAKGQLKRGDRVQVERKTINGRPMFVGTKVGK